MSVIISVPRWIDCFVLTHKDLQRNTSQIMPCSATGVGLKEKLAQRYGSWYISCNNDSVTTQQYIMISVKVKSTENTEKKQSAGLLHYCITVCIDSLYCGVISQNVTWNETKQCLKCIEVDTIDYIVLQEEAKSDIDMTYRYRYDILLYQ